MDKEWKQRQQRLGKDERLPRHFCERCTGLLDAQHVTCGDCGCARPADGWTPLDEAYDPFLGRVLCDRYLINKVEGRGASSTIYRAESLTVPKRFAIKMVKLWHGGDQSVSDQVRQRLEREVRAVGMLRNPHIVRVYELLELDRNWIALVMDHIDGATVEEMVGREGPVPVDRALNLVRQVANGLCEAHQVGMIHRDVKPENIMIERLPDGDDFAFLLDFGVVRLEDETRLTQGFLGTPMFASPEQATGGELDRRSDIYSLGATLYYMLTGRAPFESERTLEVLKAHVRKPAPTLSEGHPDAEFPRPLEDLVARMLAKRPSERPENLIEVIAALDWGERPAAIGLSEQTATPAESAELNNELRLGDEPTVNPAEAARNTDMGTEPDEARRTTHAFADPPTTRVGFHHQGKPGAPTPEARRHRSRRDSAEIDLRQTNPEHFERPMTDPKGLSSARTIQAKETVQFLPRPDGDEPAEQVGSDVSGAQILRKPSSEPKESASPGADAGIPFARTMRKCSASDSDLVSFVDSHNEVWMVGEDELQPLCAPLSRVTALATSKAGTFVGQADGSLSRVVAETNDFKALFRDKQRHAITALAASRQGHIVVAATDGEYLWQGSTQSPDKRWNSLGDVGRVHALALTDSGGMFAAARDDDSVYVATTESPQSMVANLAAPEAVVDLAFSTDGHLLAVLLASGKLHVFQVLYGRQISVLEPDSVEMLSVYFSDDNILYGVCNHKSRVVRRKLSN